MEYEEKIVAIFRRQLEAQGKRPASLTKENNPKSTIGNTKLFKIFNNAHRLGFSDFIQICQLLDLSPVDVMLELFPNPNLYNINMKKVEMLEEALEYAKELLANKSKETP